MKLTSHHKNRDDYFPPGEGGPCRKRGDSRANHLVEGALTALGQIVMWCLSVAGDDKRMEDEIGRIGAALDEVLLAPTGLAALEVLLRYLGTTHTGMRAEQVGQLLIETASTQAQEIIVTFLDEIEQRGERKGRASGLASGLASGRAEGERKGRKLLLLDQLAARFGKLPASAKTRVEKANDAELSRWALRVLTEKTLEAVLEEDEAPKTAAPKTATPKWRASQKRTTRR